MFLKNHGGSWKCFFLNSVSSGSSARHTNTDTDREMSHTAITYVYKQSDPESRIYFRIPKIHIIK